MTRSRKDVRAALANAASLDGMTIMPYPTDAFDAPGGYVTTVPHDPRLVFDSTRQISPFQIWVIVPGVDPEAAAEALDGWVDEQGLVSTSVVTAVQDGDSWTDDSADDCVVTLIGAFTEVRHQSGDRYFGIPIDVEVYW